MAFVSIKIEWDGRLARLLPSEGDGRDARPTLHRSPSGHSRTQAMHAPGQDMN